MQVCVCNLPSSSPAMASRFSSLVPLVLGLAVLFLLGADYAEGINVTFTLQKKVAFGRGIRVAGNTTTLGDWEPASAAQMEVDATTEQDWIVTVVMSLDVGVRVEYKPVITNYGTGNSPTWFPNDNLVFEIPDADALVVPIIWNADASLSTIKQVVN